MRNLKKIISILLLLLVAFTIYISISELRGSSVCLAGEGNSANCSTVQNSPYAKILGVKVTYLGTIAIILLSILFLLTNSKNKYKQNFYEIYIFGTILGFIGAVYFLSIQFFVLKAVCSTCLVVDFGIILVSVLSWVNHKIKINAPSGN